MLRSYWFAGREVTPGKPRPLSSSACLVDMLKLTTWRRCDRQGVRANAWHQIHRKQRVEYFEVDFPFETHFML